MLLPLLVLLCAGGCEPRERSNPFDPGNPSTAGEPSLLSATAGNEQVRLAWDLSRFRGIESLEILRRLDEEGAGSGDGSGGGSGGEADTVIHTAASGESGEYVDLLDRNGVTFSYRLGLHPTHGEPAYSAPVLATPGASQPWVADPSGGGMARLSPDGRTVLFRTEPFREVLDVEIQADGAVWVADYGNGAVVNYDAMGHRMREWSHTAANTLALGASDTVWVGSFNLGDVTAYTRNGQWLWADTTAGMVEEVEAAPDGGIWVGSRDRGLSRVDFGRVRFHVPSVRWPIDLEVEPGGDLWIIDRSSARVSRLSPDGMQLRVSPVSFLDPTDAALDGEGGAWIADRAGGTVTHLDDRLEESARFPIGPAQNVSWDAPNRRLWVSLPSEGRLVVVRVEPSPEGFAVVASLRLGGSPAQIEALWR